MAVTDPSLLLPLFRARYPSFSTVVDTTVLLWLEEGIGEAKTWREEDRDRAAMLYAAHRLSGSGEGGAVLPDGYTSFRSGTFSAAQSETAALRIGYEATTYGRELLALMRRSFAGPRLAWTPPIV